MNKSKKDFYSVLHGDISSAQLERSGILNTARENFAEKSRQVTRKQFSDNHWIVGGGNC